MELLDCEGDEIEHDEMEFEISDDVNDDNLEEVVGNNSNHNETRPKEVVCLSSLCDDPDVNR